MSDQTSDGPPALDEEMKTWAQLAMPFRDDEVRVREQAGRKLKYVTARTIMNRLDDVVGPSNWWDEYIPGEHSVLCKLTIRIPATGEVITKQDAGGYAGMADQGDDDKSGYSDAFKRAAVKLGIGRYLYNDGVPDFALAYFNGRQDGKADPNATPPQREQRPTEGGGQRGKWGGGEPQGSREDRPQGNAHQGPPRTGRALFAWMKEQEQKHEVGILKYINGWAKLQEYRGMMVDWTAEQVSLAHAEAVRKLKSLEGPGGDYEEALAN